MSRDVLSPPLMGMEANRNYRVNPLHDDFGEQRASMMNPAAASSSSSQPQRAYLEEGLYDDDYDGSEDNNCIVEELPNSLFKLTMHVASAFYGGIIGFKGSTKRRLESETQTEIYVPRNRDGGRSNSNREDLTITGRSRSNVYAARRKIKMLTTSLRKRMSKTHFIGVALNQGEIKENFIEFKRQILAANISGIDDNLFQLEGRLHLTLVTCVLLDDAERALVVDMFQGCREFVSDLETPFEVKVSGLEIMNDDPSAVRVLYGRVEAPHLQQFANRCLKQFLQSGFGTEERDSVKLHMTLLNSRFCKEVNAPSNQSFDAREILKRFGDFNFGLAKCSEVHLCIMGTKGSDGDDFYKVTSTLKL